MADIRIKDLPTTASLTASGDFIAIDGTSNGTRKLNAASPAFLTSVTTPSLTSPAATALTLGTTDSGAAITVLSASNNVGVGVIAPAQKLSVNGTTQWAQTDEPGYSGYLTNASTNAAYNPAITRNLIGSTGSTYTIAHGDMDAYAGIQFGLSGTTTNAGNISFFAASGSFATNESVTPVARMFIASTGDVSISSTTAGSANAGALVIAGGISAGNSNVASYFGGTVTLGTTTGQTGALIINSRDDTAGAALYLRQGNTANEYGFKFYQDNDVNGNLTIKTVNNSTEADLLTLSRSTGAATFAGTGAFGGSGTLSSTYLSRLSVFTAGAGNFSVGGQTNTNDTVVARMTAYNASNGNSGNTGVPEFMGIASIESVVKTASGNTGGDSGGDLVFLTKGDGGTLTERMRLLSTGAATFAGAVTVGGNVGFYNNAPVAKPTGVAVTAAAIHAALVTLNLIAA